MDKPCQYKREDIWNYYSGTLSRQEETNMQEHIISCEACQKKLAQLQHLDEFMTQDNNEEDIDAETEIDNELPSITIAAYPATQTNWGKIAIGIIAIAATIMLIVYLTSPKKVENYPIDMDNIERYGPADMHGVDTTYIESIQVDTLKTEEPDSIAKNK